MFPLHAPLDDALRTELAAYDDLTAALLSRRGITTKEAARKFLRPSFTEHLYNPLLMTDMERAARRLADAILSREKMVVWSDYDCDGIPGAVIMHDFLRKVGANFENYIPRRHDEGYGVNVAGIEKLAQSGATVMVTVDSGITDVLPIACAKELGVDVIVTDHHLPSFAEATEGKPVIVLPDAYAVVNPNAREDEAYPFKGLCGSGIAWKLVCAVLAIEPRLREKVPLGWEKWLLDMVALATIADMVPLIDENRVLATYGLVVMRKSPRIGLSKLCRGMRVEQRALTEDDVGFMIGPRINAASRIGDARDALLLFTTDSEVEAELLAKKLEKANRTRKAEAGAITHAVHARLKERDGGVRTVIALGDPEWRPALLGLVANNIAEEYERPVFLWGREGNMSIKGSVRSGGGIHILELMRAADNTFAEFGGHAAAGGFTVLDDAVFDLEERLVLALRSLGEEGAAVDDLSQHADAEVLLKELSASYLTKLESFAPFGVQNPKPIFLLREVPVREVLRFGKGEEHLKLKIGMGDEHGLDAVTFFAKGALARSAAALAQGGRANILGHLERDTFSRSNPVRLRLLDLRVC